MGRVVKDGNWRLGSEGWKSWGEIGEIFTDWGHNNNNFILLMLVKKCTVSLISYPLKIFRYLSLYHQVDAFFADSLKIA